MRKYFVILLCLFWAQNATAFCRTVSPKVNIVTKPGSVRYITTMSRQEFLKKAPRTMSPNTLGMTVSNLNVTGKSVPDLQQQSRAVACVQLREINLTMGYDIIDVYIDKKYKPGSCEYEVVKEHENYHVRVSQEAMQFFKPDLEKAVRAAVKRVSMQYAYSPSDVQRLVQAQFQQVMADIQPTIRHINDKIAEKNYQIDTPQSYRATSKLCKHW